MTGNSSSFFKDGESAAHLRTGGKINLFLRITGVRPDGYHELFTLFFPLAGPCDELIVRPAAERGLRVSCFAPGIDCGNNTLTSAYGRYAEATGWAPGLDVELIKGIPHGAGLGGGSADAALLLLFLQEQCPCPLDKKALNALASRVGADVPFFLEGHPCVAEGIGDKLTPCGPELAVLEGVWLVLLCPEIKISTPWAFAAWDKANRDDEADGELIPLNEPCFLTVTDKTAKTHCSIFPRPFMVENSFEPVVFAACPELGRFKADLVREGAAAAGLSGSGSALFGLFRGQDAASVAAGRLRENASGAYVVHGPFSL